MLGMKRIEDIETYEDILEAEKELFNIAERDYGDHFRNAYAFTAPVRREIPSPAAT